MVGDRRGIDRSGVVHIAEAAASVRVVAASVYMASYQRYQYKLAYPMKEPSIASVLPIRPGVLGRGEGDMMCSELQSMPANAGTELHPVGLTENPYQSLFRCNQFVLGPGSKVGDELW